MPLFSGWFRHRKQNQDKSSGPAGIEDRATSSASGSGGVLRLASLRGRRSGTLSCPIVHETLPLVA